MTIIDANEQQAKKVRNVVKVISNYLMTKCIEYNIGCGALVSILVNGSINSGVELEEVLDLIKLHWKGVEEACQENESDMSE